MTAYQMAAGWDALGDATRRAVFQRIVESPMSVGDLAAELPVSRPAVSQHLKVLVDAGLVVQRREGRRHICSVSAEGLAALRHDVERFWEQALGSFKATMEEKA